MLARRLVILALLFVIGSPAVAAADEGSEIRALEAQLQHEYDALASEGCPLACQALTSMQRAADRLCALDRGARCAEARRKVRDAEDRVRSACPECGMAAVAPPPDAPLPSAPPSPPPPVSPSQGGRASEPEEQVASGAPRRGGCAACTVGGDGGGGAGAGAFAAALALAALARRRRQGTGSRTPSSTSLGSRRARR